MIDEPCDPFPQGLFRADLAFRRSRYAEEEQERRSLAGSRCAVAAAAHHHAGTGAPSAAHGVACDTGSRRPADRYHEPHRGCTHRLSCSKNDTRRSGDLLCPPRGVAPRDNERALAIRTARALRARDGTVPPGSPTNARDLSVRPGAVWGRGLLQVTEVTVGQSVAERPFRPGRCAGALREGGET